MPAGPTKKPGTTFKGFRIPDDCLAWLEEKVPAGGTLTDAAVWAWRLARSYTDELGKLDKKIHQLAAEHDMTELGVFRRALERGLAVLEEELGAKKK